MVYESKGHSKAKYILTLAVKWHACTYCGVHNTLHHTLAAGWIIEIIEVFDEKKESIFAYK